MQEILEKYKNLLESIDSWFNSVQQRFSQSIQCRTGCSGCCRGLFDITLLDAAVVNHGYQQLTQTERQTIRTRSLARQIELQQRWPGFNSPFLLNGLPDSEWTVMPEEDEIPCPFLHDDGSCLIYAHRPMTCRLHGLPNIDLTGESFSDEYCSLNFHQIDPLLFPGLKWNFRQTFQQEFELFSLFTEQLIGRPMKEMDTFLPLVPLIDFDRTDWRNVQFYTLKDLTEPSE